MALSIGVKKGSKINIGGQRVGGTNIVENGRPKLIGYDLDGGEILEVLEVDRETIWVSFRGEEYEVTSMERVKLAEGVFVSCGPWNGKGMESYSRLAFEAPRSIRIERIATP